MELDLSLYRQRTQVGRAQASLPEHNRFVGLFGPSGAGKTSLLRGLAGLHTYTTGSFMWGSVNVDLNSNADIRKGKLSTTGDIGMVLQHPIIFPGLSVQAQLTLVESHQQQALCSMQDAVDRLALGSLLNKHAHQLSGGEIQRVGIARAILSGPKVLLLDEPVSALDDKAKHTILTWLRSLVAQGNIRIIFVSHLLDDLVSYCDGLLLMEQGSIIACGELDEVITLHSLRHSEREFLNVLEGELINQGPSNQELSNAVRQNTSENPLFQLSIGNHHVQRTQCVINQDMRTAVFTVNAQRIVIDRSSLPHTSLINALKVQVIGLEPISQNRVLVKTALVKSNTNHQEDTIIKVVVHQHSLQAIKLRVGETVTLRFDVE